MTNKVSFVCGGRIEGDFTVKEQDVRDAGFTIAIIGSSDRDFNDCDGCNVRCTGVVQNILLPAIVTVALRSTI
jgi:hypothetical protein